MADSITQLAWIADADGHITWYNRRWYDYTGTTPAEMQDWGWQKVHHPEYVYGVVERLKQAFATGQAWEDTFPLCGKDGRTVGFSCGPYPCATSRARCRAGSASARLPNP